GNSLNDFFCPHCTYEFCGNGAHVGYNCPAQVPFFQTLPSFLQQYPCCEDCGVTHEPYQCLPKNHDYYDEPNSYHDSNSFGFDQIQTPQYTVNHPIFNAHNDLLDSQNKLMEQMTSMCEMVGQVIQKKQEEKQIQEDQAANARYWKILAYYDDDDDYNFAITPNEPVDSLMMGDEHFDTIPATESDKFIKSSVENLVLNPSESEGENGCDMLACFTSFSNILFDAEYEFDSVDDQSLHNEDFSENIFSNPLFEEEINSMRIDQHHFNVESDLIESLLNHDSSIIPSSSKIDSLLDEFADSLIIYSSSKIDYLLDEFAGELILLKSIPPRIDKADCDPKEEIRLDERLLYDNSSPRPPEEFIFENSDAIIESFSSSLIPVEDSDPFMEKIDLFLAFDRSIPSGIDNDYSDSEGDNLFLERLLQDDLIPLPNTFDFSIVETDTQEKDKNDKTEHKMEKIEKDKAIRSRKVKSQSPRSTKVNPKKVKVNPDKAEVEKWRKYNLRDQICKTLKVVLKAEISQGLFCKSVKTLGGSFAKPKLPTPLRTNNVSPHLLAGAKSAKNPNNTNPPHSNDCAQLLCTVLPAKAYCTLCLLF
nr:hypothetical protein [Tanacetum cinerariifolium]